jgi:hypothetical protein
LIAAGIKKGPAVGKALKILLKAVMEEDLENEKKALLEYLAKGENHVN